MTGKTRLIRKTAKTFLVTGLLLACFSSIILYFYTKHLLQNEIEEELYSTEARIETALNEHQFLYSLPPVTEVKKVVSLKQEILKDTLIYDPSQDEVELFRELSTFKQIHGENYQITVRDLVVESDEILVAIVIANIGVFILAFLFLFYFNTAQNIKLWKSFFYNLEQMKAFSLTSKEPISLMDSDILEFSELKFEIAVLTQKVRSDYENLKQFTEDVSHEMQTPLAIIQAKIDTIINDQSINNEQFEQITSVQAHIQKLKQLIKRLTILTKIDNNQFTNIEKVNFTSLVKQIIGNFKELEMTNIIFDANAELQLQMDPYLADVLVNNLLSNAIKHSKDKSSEITVNMDDTTLYVYNAGNSALNHPEKLFSRFYREAHNNQSTGLGLSIVKKICDIYGFRLSYGFSQNQHCFSVVFK